MHLRSLKGKCKNSPTFLFSSVSWDFNLLPLQEDQVWDGVEVQCKRRMFTFSPNSTNQQHFGKPWRNSLVCVAKCLLLSGCLGFWNSDTKWKTKQRAKEEALARRRDMEMELFTSGMIPPGTGSSTETQEGGESCKARPGVGSALCINTELHFASILRIFHKASISF